MTSEEFNLEPNPRVLPMLGEINLEQWRCVAELVDNAVDGFLHASRAGETVPNARVDVQLPAADKDGAMVRIQDNGPGMAPDVLEKAVKAGWSGNNPIDSLGLFGMGFNIATARLGTVTEVWTTRKGEAEWHGLSIDFDALQRQRHFRVPHLRRPKADPQQHGTEITIKQLKPEQRRQLAKNANQTMIRKRLSQAYSSMLRANGLPISFELHLNNKRLEARRHCVWNEDRVVPGPGGINTNAVIPINHALSERPYCMNCMSWVVEGAEDEPCPNCKATGSVVKRTRRIRGWLGIQRYLDQSEFGIDFIRNGRKIEIASKDLFSWHDGENEEREYPIDDQRNRGRIVGEIHIDHCRVSYAKDRFDRADPTWNEMVELLRGEGPLRPEKAKDLGYGPNDTPLFRLFKAFRRTSPHSKTAGAYARILVVKDNNRASDMATYFHDGSPEFQDDTKWWELVEAADRELLYGQSVTPSRQGGSGKPSTSSGGSDELPAGILDEDDGSGSTSSGTPTTTTSTPPVQPPPPPRREVPTLSGKYIYSPANATWSVVAFEVGPKDPDVPTNAPWILKLADVTTRTFHYLYNPGHPLFRSITMTPRDGLLSDLAYKTAELLRTSNSSPDIVPLLTEFRTQYGDENALDFKSLPTDATTVLIDVARALVSSCPAEDRPSLYNDLSLQEQGTIMRSLANKKIKPAEAIMDGSFLQSAPLEIIKTLVISRPELCFDGGVWTEAYSDIDYNDADITEEARRSVLSKYVGLISDAIWLSKQDVSDFGAAPKNEIVRAVMSLQLLRPDVEPAQ